MRVTIQKKSLGIQYQMGVTAEGQPRMEMKTYAMVTDATDANLLAVGKAISGLCASSFQGVEKIDTSEILD